MPEAIARAHRWRHEYYEFLSVSQPYTYIIGEKLMVKLEIIFRSYKQFLKIYNVQ